MINKISKEHIVYWGNDVISVPRFPGCGDLILPSVAESRFVWLDGCVDCQGTEDEVTGDCFGLVLPLSLY